MIGFTPPTDETSLMRAHNRAFKLYGSLSGYAMVLALHTAVGETKAKIYTWVQNRELSLEEYNRLIQDFVVTDTGRYEIFDLRKTVSIEEYNAERQLPIDK